jgi:hypothetical protein
MSTRLPTLHPLLIAAYPILYLYGINAGKIPVAETFVPLAISWAAVALIWIVAARLLRDTKSGAIVASGVVVLFFVTLPAFKILTGLGLSRPVGAASLAALVGLTGAVVLLKHRQLAWFSTFLDVTSAVALVTLLGTTLPRAVHFGDRTLAAPNPTVDIRAGTLRPDIYYIVLDGYGRSDVLKDLYGFDTAPYTGKLEDLGFYVAAQSAANYGQTLLSLASALNFMYLDDLAHRVGTESDDRTFLRDLIWNNGVVSALKAAGYRFVTFSTGFWGTDRMGRADTRMSSGSGLSEYRNVLLSNSPLPAIFAKLPVGTLRDWQFRAHRTTVQYVFDELPRLPESSAPRFVFAHVLSPHPPFVFGPNGEPVNPAGGFTLNDGDLTRSRRPEYLRAYASQAQFIIASATKAAGEILARNPDAVIIIQGDHGPRGHLIWNNHARTNMRETLAILNTYHVPTDVKAQLYPHISPVNTFRVLFNHLFASKLPLLEDEAYFSLWSSPYDFRKVTHEVNPPGAPSTASAAEVLTCESTRRTMPSGDPCP